MKLSLPLVGRREVAERTMSFAFELDGKASRSARQYVNITQAVPVSDEKGNTRPFHHLLT